MRLGFACPYLATTPEVVISQLGAVMDVAIRHPFFAMIGTNRVPHVKACERILQRALANPHLDALFWTEDDCILPKDAITRLVKLLEEHPEADVVTGITFQRYEPYFPMIADYVGVVTEEMLRNEYGRFKTIDGGPGEETLGREHFRFRTKIDTSAPPERVDASSMNCLLLRRKALEVLGKIDGPFDVGRFTTPDFAMFAHLREAGIVTLVDNSLLTLHLGEPRKVGFEDWVGAMERMCEKGAAERVETPDGSAA